MKTSPLFQNRLKHQDLIKFSTKKHLPFHLMKYRAHSILTYTTQRTKEKYVKLTKLLVPASKIPEQLELGRKKLVYLLQFGLAPYYKEQLFNNLYLASTSHLVTFRIACKSMFLFFTFMRRNNK